MEVSRIIAEIDSQISKLQQARALLSETTAAPAVAVKRAGRGRPKGSKNAVKKAAVTTSVTSSAKVKGQRKISPEGRKRIADAMKKRWAERRKQTSK